MMESVRVGIIGGGLMGKEVAGAFGRWFTLNDYPLNVQLKAVCDINQETLGWYKNIPTVELLTTNYRELLNDSMIDVVYVALPHHLHGEYYREVMNAGKDLLAEKPFGIDLAVAQAVKKQAEESGVFVRCSSEMPFFPGPQRLMKEIESGALGEIMEINAGFYHSSDMDPLKPINWKRHSRFCGEVGVMGDLGMHVLHVPLRMGWMPVRVYAQLQKIVTRRPNSQGGWSECDTWNNATLATSVVIDDNEIPMRLEMKRLAPGETNSWFIEVLGREGGVRYNTKDTKALWLFQREDKDQSWRRLDMGFQVPFSTVTGGIFEPGFPDCFMQMLAAYFAERGGFLENRFGCVTPEEAVMSHQVFDAALKSQRTKSTVEI